MMCGVPNSTNFWISSWWIFQGNFSRLLSIPFFITRNAPTITSTVDNFIFHNFVILISRSLYLESVFSSFRDTFQLDCTLISIRVQLLSFLSLIIMYRLLAFIFFLSVCNTFILGFRLMFIPYTVTLLSANYSVDIFSSECTQAALTTCDYMIEELIYTHSILWVCSAFCYSVARLWSWVATISLLVSALRFFLGQHLLTWLSFLASSVFLPRFLLSLFEHASYFLV